MYSVVQRPRPRPETLIRIDVNNFSSSASDSRDGAGSRSHWLTSIEANLIDVRYYESQPVQTVFQDVIDGLKDELISQLKNIDPDYYGMMSTSDILDKVHVRCYILNEERKEQISTKSETAAEAMTIETYQRLWYQILQSNSHQTIYDLFFGIYVQSSAILRGSGRPKQTFKGVSPTPVSAYCLAYALYKAIDHRNRILTPSVSSLSSAQFKRNYMAFAEQLHLDSHESIDSISTKFLVHESYNHLRVIVVSPYVHHILPDCIYKGRRWEFSMVPNRQGSNHKCDLNTIYLLYDRSAKHFDWMTSPLNFFRVNRTGSAHSNSWNLCDACTPPCFYRSNQRHICDARDGEIVEPTAKRYKTSSGERCPECDVVMYGDRHRCGHFYCQRCKAHFTGSFRERDTHRCFINPSTYDHEGLNLDLSAHDVLLSDDDESEADDDTETIADSSDLPDVWAWDIETMFEYHEVQYQSRCSVSENPEEIEEGEIVDNPHPIRKIRPHHVPCMVVAANIRDTSELKVFPNIEEFLEFFIARSKQRDPGIKGKRVPRTYFFAHNSSGYDARLLFQYGKKYGGMDRKAPLFRGTKIMALYINHLTFLDSMLHISGSLRSIVHSFLKPEVAAIRAKGYFPYLFNTVDNQDYIGSLPEKEKFDMKHMKVKEVPLFEKWYDEELLKNEPYNLKEQMKAYCIQDVLALAEVLVEYEKSHLSVHGLSPLTKTTAASVAKHVYQERYMPPDQIAQLTYAEQSFARQALRGGRTDVKRLHFELTPEMEAEGGFIAYRDVCSLYPYVMLSSEFKYPVGLPEIHVFKTDRTRGADKYAPLLVGQYINGKKNKDAYRHKMLPSLPQPPDLRQFVLDSFGFLEIDGYWSDEAKRTIIHPPLPVFDVNDEGESKCLFHLDALYEKTFCSEELKVAVNDGFIVTRIHRYDYYNSSTVLWKDFFVKFMKLKNIYSKPSILSFPLEDQPSIRLKYQKICDDYKNQYDIEMTPEEFEDNPPKKQTFKIILNSLWGKFAQSVEHAECRIIDMNKKKGPLTLHSLEIQHDEGLLQIDSAPFSIHENTIMVSVKRIGHTSDYSEPLSNVNVACAAFVPMYGRLTLYAQLKKLGKNILMHDTDSIIAYVPPGQSHLLPPEGKIVGG